MTSKHSIGHFHWTVLKHLSRHNTERYVDGVEVAIDCKTTGRRLVHWASSLLIISACGLQDAGSIGRTAMHMVGRASMQTTTEGHMHSIGASQCSSIRLPSLPLRNHVIVKQNAIASTNEFDYVW